MTGATSYNNNQKEAIIMTTYKQLNIDDHIKLLIPSQIQLNKFLGDTIALIQNRRLANLNERFNDGLEKLTNYSQQTIKKLTTLKNKIAPEVEQMKAVADDTARSNVGQTLSEKYNPMLRAIYNRFINQVDNTQQAIVQDNNLDPFQLAHHFENVKYRKIDRLIDAINDFQTKLNTQKDLLKCHLLTNNLQPSHHLLNSEFHDELSRLHPEYQGIKAINIQDEFVILEEVDNNGNSEYTIDYDEFWWFSNNFSCEIWLMEFSCYNNDIDFIVTISQKEAWLKMDKIKELSLQISSLQKERRALQKANGQSLSAKRTTYGWNRAELSQHLDQIAKQLGCQHQRVDRYVDEFIDDNGNSTTFVVRTSKEWFDKMSKKQKEVLNSRSWHSIKVDQVNSWSTSGVDYMVFLISKHNTDKSNAFILPMTQVVQMCQEPGRETANRAMFYFGLDKQNRAIECRTDQLNPTLLDIEPNNWSTLNPRNSQTK